MRLQVTTNRRDGVKIRGQRVYRFGEEFDVPDDRSGKIIAKALLAARFVRRAEPVIIGSPPPAPPAAAAAAQHEPVDEPAEVPATPEDQAAPDDTSVDPVTTDGDLIFPSTQRRRYQRRDMVPEE